MSNIVDRVLNDMYKQCKRKARQDAIREIKAELASVRQLKADLLKSQATIRSLMKQVVEKDRKLKAAAEKERLIVREYQKISQLKSRTLGSFFRESIYGAPKWVTRARRSINSTKIRDKK